EFFKLYHYDLLTHDVTVHDLQQARGWSPLSYGNGVFIACRWDSPAAKYIFQEVDAVTGHVQTCLPFSKERDTCTLEGHNFAVAELKPVINPGYSCISQVKYFGMTHSGHICMDGRELLVNEMGEMIWGLHCSSGGYGNTSVRTEHIGIL